MCCQAEDPRVKELQMQVHELEHELQSRPGGGNSGAGGPGAGGDDEAFKAARAVVLGQSKAFGGRYEMHLMDEGGEGQSTTQTR